MNYRLGEQTYYDLLEVAEDAPQHEVHAAYQRAKETYSPESPALYSMFTPEEARELLAMIEDAFRVLSNYGSRQKYDLHLKQVRAQGATSHEDLPDFVMPEEPSFDLGGSSTVVRTNPVPKKEDLPKGFARTKLSTYPVNDEFEKEIAAAEEFSGQYLQKIRTYKKVDLDRLSEETRVSRTYLIAIETEDYEALPAPVFVRGFVVQYARLLGLDDKRVADSYMKQFKKARP